MRNLTKNKQIKKVLIWGLAYTENTDTLRRSLSIEIAKWLRANKTNIFAYDEKIKKISSKIKKILKIVNHPLSNIKNVDVLIILKKSDEIIKISPKDLKKMNKKLIIIDPNYICNHFQKIF